MERLKRKLQWLINYYHLGRSILANIIYGFPSRRLKVIGVTGTDGKTTTSHLIYHILKSTGRKVALISSVSARIGDEEMETGLHRTTPDAFEMQPIIKRIADKGFEYLVLETTSHALDQNRVYGIKYEVGVSTNVTPEHLDYHKTYANLLRTKAKLLLRAKTSIINKDDGSFAELSEYLKSKNKSFLTYGIKTQADFSVDFNKSYKLHV
ncbi:MAG: Mur ligase family protein, partial [Patescibacteria group bacterium]